MSNPYDGIVANIFIGGEYAAKTFGHQFELLVNCAASLSCPPNHKNCIHLPVHQNEKFAKFYFDMIHETGVLDRIHAHVLRNEPVLIYCIQGMHRSCTLVACYLMKYHNLNVEQVIKFIKTNRPIAFNPVYNLLETMHLFFRHIHPRGHIEMQTFSLPEPTVPYTNTNTDLQLASGPELAPEQKPQPAPKKEEKKYVVPAPKTPKLVEKNEKNCNQKEQPEKKKNHK